MTTGSGMALLVVGGGSLVVGCWRSRSEARSNYPRSTTHNQQQPTTHPQPSKTNPAGVPGKAHPPGWLKEEKATHPRRRIRRPPPRSQNSEPAGDEGEERE